MIILVQSRDYYDADLRAMLQAFYPEERISAVSEEELRSFGDNLISEIRFILKARYVGKELILQIEEMKKVLFSAYIYGDPEDRKRFRNSMKLGVYRLLSEYSGRTLPWGSLTGMRPTKIASQRRAEGMSDKDIEEYYMQTYDCSPEKARLSTYVSKRENRILSEADPESDYCLYIGIPFCPSRCLYCSFAAYPIARYKDYVWDYIDAVIVELQNIALMNTGRKLISVYVGGGTPTSLTAGQLEKLLGAVRDIFDMSSVREFTVEAGRPDSISSDKLSAMKRCGVTRISINPQTMNDRTLRAIGRNHSSEQIRSAFGTARSMGFRDINMDLIAGLPDEDIADLENTLSEVLRLRPDSVTVHSLAVKRAARLSEELAAYQPRINLDAPEMVSLAEKRLTAKGYKPYYLYRQRNIAGNLENVGYAREGFECLYNILIIEEHIDIFAAGAGGVSRIRRADGSATMRAANVKSVEEYIDRVDEMVARKRKAVEEKLGDS